MFGMPSTEKMNDPSPFVGTKPRWQGLKRSGRHRKVLNKLNRTKISETPIWEIIWKVDMKIRLLTSYYTLKSISFMVCYHWKTKEELQSIRKMEKRSISRVGKKNKLI